MGLGVDLYSAVSDGDEERVRRLLQQGADPNICIEPSGMQPMLVAAQFFPFLIEPLAAAGARLGREYRDKGTGRMLGPLNFAAREETGEAIEILVRLGMNPRENDDALFDAAFHALVADNIRLLASLGCDVDVRVGTNLNTPLLMAAFFGRTDSVRALIEVGASVDARDWRDNTSLRFAVHGGHVEIVRQLLDAGAVVEPGMETPEFWVPTQFGKPQLSKMLRLFASHLMARSVHGAMGEDRESGVPASGRPDIGVL